MKINASGRSALIIAAGFWIWCSGPLQAQDATSAQAAPVAAQQPPQPSPLQQLFGVKPTAAAAEQPAPTDVGKPVALNKYTRHRSHRRKHQSASRSRSHKSTARAKSKVTDSKVTKSADKPKVAERADKAKIANADNDSPAPVTKSDDTSKLSESVANAKAQLIEPNSTSGGVATMTPAQNNPPAQRDTTAAPTVAATAATDNAGTANAKVVPSDELNEVDRALSSHAEPAPTLALASINPPATTTGQAATSSDDGSSWAKASLIGKMFLAFGGLLTLASAARMLIA